MNLILWLALFIPLPVLGVAFYAGLRPAIQTIAAMVLSTTFIVLVARYGTSALMTSDSEHWSGFATLTNFKEDHTETRVVVETDSRGNISTRIVTDYYPPEYWVVDSNGISVSVDEPTYGELAVRWGVAKPPLHRTHNGSGRTHAFKWGGKDATAEVVVTRHHYENRTLATHSVFEYADVPPELVDTLRLHPWPGISGYYTSPSTLGINVPETERLFGLMNARIGHKYQIRVLLVGFVNVGPEAAVAQEALWKGGKKNELVVCVGLNDTGTTTWARCFAWENEQCKAAVSAAIPLGLPLDAKHLVAAIEEQVSRSWKRKPFSDFDYLVVEPPGWVVVLTHFLVLVTCILCLFVDWRMKSVY